jgi:hypothetical protein
LTGLCEHSATAIQNSGLDPFTLSREILAEPLTGIVFPSESAARKSLDTDMLMARYKAQQIIEARPVTRTELVQDESFNGWPVWAVPASFAETVAETPLSPETVCEGEERARELRLYAARLKVASGTCQIRKQ